MEMEAFLIAGWNVGAGRTTTSILLSTGLARWGLNPLHVEITCHDRAPVIHGVANVPFATAFLRGAEGAATATDIKDCAARYPERSPIVVDLPAERIRPELCEDPAFQILLPLRTGKADVQCVARDLSDAVERAEHRRDPAAWIIPIGWPAVLLWPEYWAVLARSMALSPRIEGVSVIRPGLPELDLEASPLVANGTFAPSPRQEEAAIVLARWVLRATDSPMEDSLIDPTFGWPEGM